MNNMTAKTTADRQKALRERRERMGLAEIRGIWLRPEDFPALRVAAAKLRRKRERAIDRAREPQK